MSQGPILITGGRGFIGGYLARRLHADGRDVVLVGRGPATREMDVVLEGLDNHEAFVQASVTSLEVMCEVMERRKPSAVVHLAANVEVVELAGDPYSAFAANAAGTVNVFEAARRTNVERIVYCSSIGVLPPPLYEPIDANHPLVLARRGPGAGSYGASKAAGELFAFAYSDAYGLPIYVVRPSAPYGFGMPAHSPNYMKNIVEPVVRGELVRLPTGGPLRRDYTHVEDVAALMAAALDAPEDADRIFFAATGEPLVTAADVVRIVERMVPGADIEIGGVLSAEDESEDSFRGRISIENARTQLGWAPQFTSLEDGIREYISRYDSFLRLSKG